MARRSGILPRLRQQLGGQRFYSDLRVGVPLDVPSRVQHQANSRMYRNFVVMPGMGCKLSSAVRVDQMTLAWIHPLTQ